MALSERIHGLRPVSKFDIDIFSEQAYTGAQEGVLGGQPKAPKNEKTAAGLFLSLSCLLRFTVWEYEDVHYFRIRQAVPLGYLLDMGKGESLSTL